MLIHAQYAEYLEMDTGSVYYEMVDVNKPVTNPSLVSAMNQLQAEPSPGYELVFLDELKKAYFLAPVTITPQPEPGDEAGKTVLKETTTIGFQMITNNEECSFFPVFTDWGELSKWRNEPNQQTLLVTFDDISAKILRDTDTSSGLAIKPCGQNILLDKERIAMFNGKPVSQPYTLEKETKVLLGEPKEYPHALAEAVKRHLKTVKEVKKAYLMLMVKDSEQSFLIVVDFNGDTKKVFDGIAAVATPHLKSDQYIDIVPAGDQFGRDATRGKKPFYSRGLFGF